MAARKGKKQVHNGKTAALELKPEPKQEEPLEEESEGSLDEDSHDDEGLQDDEEGSMMDEDEDEEGEGSEDDDSDDEDDEEDEEDMDGNDNDGQGPPLKKAKGKGDSKYAIPTAEEARHLRETEDLFRSNLLRLEVQEVLSDVRVAWGSKRLRGLESFLHDLRDTLIGLKPKDVPSSLQLEGFPFLKHSAQAPLPAQWSFEPPSSVDVLGSFMIKTTCKPGLMVDVGVCLPAGLLTRFDHLNYQYFNKRHQYLAHLHKELERASVSKGWGLEVRAVPFKGDNRKAVLELRGAEGGPLGGWGVRLLPMLHFDKGTGGMDRRMVATLTRCNVRREAYKSEEERATPHYNTAILEDSAHKQHLALLHHHLGQGQGQGQGGGVGEGLLLLKVWGAQRSMDQGGDSMDGFLAAMLTLHLLETKRINHKMEALGSFMAMLSFLGETDLTTTPLAITTPLAHNDTHAQPNVGVSLSECKGLFDVTLLVQATGVNVAARVSVSAALELRREAKASLALLQEAGRHALSSVLLTPVPFLRNYDLLARLPLPHNYNSPLAATPEEESLVGDLGVAHYTCRRLYDVWAKALGDRALRLRTTLAQPQPQPLAGEQRGEGHTQGQGQGQGQGWVWGGVAIEPTNALRLVDRGPPADDTLAAHEFRALWGSRAELRRFKDGAIVEAVVWTSDVSQRHTITPTIMKHAAALHMGHRLVEGGLVLLGSELDPLVDLGPTTDADKCTRSALAALETLSKKLKGLKGMPLSIDGVEALDCSLRYTSVFPPLPHPLGHGAGKLERTLEGQQVSAIIAPLCVQVRLESSSKWPEDLPAFRDAKTAFLLHIARQLQRDSEVKAVASVEWVDIALQGFVFRTSLAVPKELRLVHALTHAQPKTGYEEQRVSLSHRLSSHPVHHRLIQALHTQRPLYGPLVRLCVLWASHHLLYGPTHLTHQHMELMVAHLFARPAPFQAPGSLLSGVLGFLWLLSSHDWALQPLIVDPHHILTVVEVESAEKAFEDMRGPDHRHGPPMAILAPYDKEHGWLPSTWGSCEKVVLSRARSLAKSSLHRLLHYMTTSNTTSATTSQEQWRAALLPPLAPLLPAFDVLIRLEEEVVGPLSSPYSTGTQALAQHRLGCKALRSAKLYRNTATAHNQQRVVGFDPVSSLVCRLEREYGHLALFFTNPLHTTLIAVLWRPSAFLPSAFAVLQSRRHMPAAGSAAPMLVPNVMEVLGEWRDKGQGLVHSIQLTSDDNNNNR